MDEILGSDVGKEYQKYGDLIIKDPKKIIKNNLEIDEKYDLFQSEKEQNSQINNV